MKFNNLSDGKSEIIHDYTNVDFILVYDITSDNSKEANQIKRRTFERNLITRGVKVTKVDGINDITLCFVLLTIPWNLLLKFADAMKMKMPLKTTMNTPPVSTFESLINWVPAIFSLPEISVFESNHSYWSAFRIDKQEIFAMEPTKSFFTKSQKSLIAYEILIRTQYTEIQEDVGIDRLITEGVYLAAYPLHEGKFRARFLSDDKKSERQILYEYWARPKRFFRYQPIQLIRKYFGEKIAIYFAWLGLYTSFLIPASIIGTIGFLYNLITFGNNDQSEEICNETGIGSFVMCPFCDKDCDYWMLYESCLFFKIAGMFDNSFTIIFSLFMSIWGSTFLKLWIRKQTDLQFSWNTNDFEDMENRRLEYEKQCKKQRINPVTGEYEWYMNTYDKFSRKFISFMAVFFMITIVLTVILTVILIRIIITGIFYRARLDVTGSYAKLLTSILAAMLDLCAILLLNLIYQFIAKRLTDFENPRTQTEYDDILTLKMYIFQFFNFYCSLFYIAFVKGSFIGRPGDYAYIFGWRQEECDPAGCLMELSIQMIVIFVGKQILNNIMELSFPLIKRKWLFYLYKFKHRNTRKSKLARLSTKTTESSETPEACNSSNNNNNNTQISHKHSKGIPQWEKDFYLLDTNQMDIFDEYLEMVIQYGFVTLFAAAMPLAPLFALMNNIIEIRIDAYKMLTKWRRPLAKQAQDIGIWFSILKVISTIAVVSNAFIISYTSSAVPQLVFRYYYNDKSWNLKGYVNFSLSIFNISDFQQLNIPLHTLDALKNITICRYRDFRDSIQSNTNYSVSTVYWHVLAARLAFVIVFEHVVFFFSTVINWLIPTVSHSIKIRIEQEKLLNKKLMFQAGAEELKRVLADTGFSVSDTEEDQFNTTPVRKLNKNRNQNHQQM